MKFVNAARRPGHQQVLEAMQQTLTTKGKGIIIMSMPRRKMQAQKEMRRIDSSETMMKFDELENRIERMEAEADMVNLAKRLPWRTNWIGCR